MSDSTDGKQHVLIHGASSSNPQAATERARVDSSGNFVVTLGTLIAGEFNGTSPTAGYQRTVGRRNATVITKQTAMTIGAGAASDTMLDSVTFIKALTGTCVVDGFPDESGSAVSIIFPAATAAGNYKMGDIVNAAGPLKFTCSNSADQALTVVAWLPA